MKPSDAESTSDTDEEARCDGSQDMDDLESGDALLLVNVIITSVKKSSPICSESVSC